MSCLALSLQPSNGSDILIQTREWFPPPRALVATSAFRQTRLAFAATKNPARNQSSSSDEYSPSASSDSLSSLGDDPLAASSGQLIVGVESQYRVVYRLVNGIYVLGITIADDHDNSVNVFECIHVVNQAVSVVVAACRGVDVTPEKLSRKYAEIYMALDIVLRGVSSIRLAAMLASIHGESIAKMVHSALDTESKIRGGESWLAMEGHAIERESNVAAFSNAVFELPPETLASGDHVAASLAPVEQLDNKKEEKEEEKEETKDPFAASEVVNKQEDLAGEFKKDKSQSKDLTLALAGLEVTALPNAEATKATHINVEGFEGDYGGIEFNNEQASLGETFEGFSEAWGGGLDASEFVGTKKIPKQEGLSGLELLQTGADPAVVVKSAATGDSTGTPLDNLLVQKTEMKGPEMYIVEEVSAEFRESQLARVGLMGVVYLKTLPIGRAGDKETEFSFRVDNTKAVKRFVMHNSKVSSLGNGMFHVRTAASDEPIPIFKYSLVPSLTPLPLRVRLVQRHSGTLFSVMIQYVSNPDLPVPLSDVTFLLKLPVDPTLLTVSPKAALNRSQKELKWVVPEIPLKGSPGKLRVRMPVDISEGEGDEDIEAVCYIKFSMEGATSLSEICLRPASEGNTDFHEVDHRYQSGVYTCN